MDGGCLLILYGYTQDSYLILVYCVSIFINEAQSIIKIQVGPFAANPLRTETF